ncbi:hypothetical protein BDQ17DRAFT_389600 [Cyathus striatus]|nr:hypothetical protein BDQ17DRAFT_389600 [Cyathus striatus]
MFLLTTATSIILTLSVTTLFISLLFPSCGYKRSHDNSEVIDVHRDKRPKSREEPKDWRDVYLSSPGRKPQPARTRRDSSERLCSGERNWDRGRERRGDYSRRRDSDYRRTRDYGKETGRNDHVRNYDREKDRRERGRGEGRHMDGEREISPRSSARRSKSLLSYYSRSPIQNAGINSEASLSKDDEKEEGE